MRQRSTLSEIVTLAAFCGFLLFFGLGAFGLVGADEPRYAQIAREMLARHDWVVPVLNGKPWLEKPVLYYWEAMVSYSIFGVSDWAARIPGAFSASTMVVAIHVFWRRVTNSTTENTKEHGADGSNSAIRQFGSSAVALDAALITLSTAGVIGYGRAASTDMPLAANFTIAMLCWVARYTESDSPNEGGWQARLLLFYVFMALATLAKGPVAPGLAAIIIVLFAIALRQQKMIWQTLWWPGIIAYLAIAAPWYWLAQQRTGTFFRVFFLEHNLERYTSNVYRHPQPFWFYIPVTLLAVVPWVVWAVCGWANSTREWVATRRAATPGATPTRNSQLTLFLAIWAIVPVVFFSFSGSKLPGYILPAVPAWALLATMSIARHAGGEGRRNLILVLLHSAMAAGLVAAVILAPYRTLRAPITPTAAWTASIVAFMLFAGIALTLMRRGLAWLRFVTLVPVVLAVAYILRIGAPALDARLSARPVAQELARMETGSKQVAVLHVKRELEYGLNFYRNQPIASYDRAEIPVGDHLVVARAGSESELSDLAGGRRVVRLGEFPAQQVEFFWVTKGAKSMMPMQ